VPCPTFNFREISHLSYADDTLIIIQDNIQDNDGDMGLFLILLFVVGLAILLMFVVGLFLLWDGIHLKFYSHHSRFYWEGPWSKRKYHW
jgi:hypothetical protein